MNKVNTRHILVIGGIILIAALSRLFPHYPNVTPIGAMALFGAAYFGKKYYAVLVPIIALIISDIVLYATIYSSYEYSIGFHLWIYGSMVLITLLGMAILRKVKLGTIVTGAIVASLVFFLISNFASWLVSPMYPKTASGLMTAYEAGLPFFWNTILGNFFYCGVLFGAYSLIEYLIPSLNRSRAV